MRRKINIVESIDWVTIVIFLLLVFIGWVNIYSAVYNPDIKGIFDFDSRAGKQFVWIMCAFLLAIIVLIIDYRFYSFFAYILYGITLVLLLGVLFTPAIKGAKSWFSLGGVSLQPSEFVKLTTALALAKLGSSHFYKITIPKWLSISMAIIFVPMLLILKQPDLGSAMVFLAFVFVLYREGFSGIVVFLGFYLIVLFVFSLVFEKSVVFIFSLLVTFALFYYFEKRMRLTFKALVFMVLSIALMLLVNRYILNRYFNFYKILVLTSTILSIAFMWIAGKSKIANIYVVVAFLFSSVVINYSVDKIFNNVLSERHQKRINIVLGLEDDPLGVGYNVEQSKIAIGSGGFSGKGYLKGTQTKFKFVPEQTTDFIFCTIGEEWGFMGSLVLIVLYITLLLRLLYLAERQRSVFSRMMGYSVFSVFLLHFIINIGMTVGLMPVIGIPLPFVSYGGSSLWAFTMFLFIFLRLDASRSVYYK